MEIVKLQFDRGTRFLIVLNLFFLISIVTGGILHDQLRDHITVQMGMVGGLSIGLGTIIGTAYWLRKRKGEKHG